MPAYPAKTEYAAIIVGCEYLDLLPTIKAVHPDTPIIKHAVLPYETVKDGGIDFVYNGLETVALLPHILSEINST